MKTYFSLSLRLVPAMDTFIMSVMVFSPIGLVWTWCFKFSVPFATEVEKNRPSHGCFNRGLCSTKDLKKATGHLSAATNNVLHFKSLLLAWKTCILVLKSVAVMACLWLPPFLLFMFYFGVVCKAQFRRRASAVPNLIVIWFDCSTAGKQLWFRHRARVEPNSGFTDAS